MKVASAQTSFLGGEWSKSAQGRFDDPAYKTAMNVCRNGMPIETGAWNRRSGTLRVSETRLGGPGRLNKFDFSQATPYNLVFTDLALRFQTGDRYATTNDAQIISAISSTTPVQITTVAPHGWNSGDSVTYSQLGLLFLTLQNRQFQITVVDSLNFTLADVVSVPGTSTAVPPDASFGALVGIETVQRIQEIVTPYSTGDWQALRVVQAIIEQNSQPQSLALILRATQPPYVLSLEGEPIGLADAQFDLNPASFVDGPYFDPIGHGAVITPGALSGNITFTINFPAYVAATSYSNGDFVFDGTNNYQSLIDQNQGNTPASSPSDWVLASPGLAVGPNGFQGTDIGRHMRFLSEPPLWKSATSYTTGNVVKFNGTYWAALTSMTGASPSTGSINPNQPGNLATTWALCPSAARWVWGKITSLGNAVAAGTPIGNMTANGGLSRAFDNNRAQNASVCAGFIGANHSYPVSGSFTTSGAYIGTHFGSAQKVGSVSLYPANDYGFVAGKNASSGAFVNLGTATDALGAPALGNPNFTIHLRAKHTAPASATDGTIIGTYKLAYSGVIGNGLYPYTNGLSIVSTDQTTAWEYVWIEVSFSMKNIGTIFTFSTETMFTLAEFVAFAPTGAGGSSTSVVVQVIGDPLLYTTDIQTWRLGLYSDTTGYPSAGGYHEGRILLNGPIPNRFDASEANNIFVFSPTEEDGTVTDENAISYTFNASDVNAILWFESDQQGVIIGTQAGEWLVQATTQNDPLTPTSIQAHRVTRIRCANIEPRRTDHTLVLVQNHKRRLMEYFADIFSGKFQAPNLAEKSKHLTAAGIAQVEYQQDLMPVIWMRMDDGTLAGTSYKRDSLMSSQGPTFNGWHRHDLGSGSSVSSIAVGPSSDGELESLSMITQPASGTQPYVIEVMGDAFEETTALIDAQFLDQAIVPSSYDTNGVGFNTGVTLNGLWALNGQTVTVFGCGLDLGDYLVTGGSLTVPFGDGIQVGAGSGLFTSALLNSFNGVAPFLVGYCFTSQGQRLRPMLPDQVGTQLGSGLGIIRAINEVSMMVVSAINRTMSIGVLFDAVRKVLFLSPSRRELSANQVFSGIINQTLDAKNSDFNGEFGWSITRPLPLLIPAVSSFVEAQDKK